MVFPRDGDYMATEHGRERPKTRHNFTLPNLKWGIQRTLRCMKDESGAGDRRLRRRSSPIKFGGASPSFRFGGGFENRNRRLETQPWRSAEDGVGEGVEEFRERIMSDLRAMTESIFRKQVLGEEEEEEEEKDIKKEELESEPPEAPGVEVEVRPWNLRKRRAACKAPITETGNCDSNQYKDKGLGVSEEKPILGNKSANSTRTRLVSTLAKKEIEDDYLTLIGQRPPRRPKKRPRTVQKQVDLLYPASYFTEITPDIYKVSDAAENRKR